MSSRQIFHIIFRRIVLEAAQIWQEELFHIIFRQIVLEAAQIWREPQKKQTQPHNCTGSDLMGTGFTLFSGELEPKKLTQHHNCMVLLST